MAFASSALSSPLDRAFSIGPIKMEIQNVSAASGDTSGTVTASRLHIVYAAIACGGPSLSAQPTISGTSVTLAFADPLANVAGKILLLGA